MTRSSKPYLAHLLLAVSLVVISVAGCKKSTPEGGTTAAQPGTTAATPGQASPTAAPGAEPGSSAGVAPLPGHSAADAKPVDPAKLPAVVARINGVEVKKAELIQEAQAFRQQLAQTRGIQAPLNAQVFHEALNNLIARTLLQQEAKEQNVTVSDAEIEQQLASVRSRFSDAAAFQKALAAEGKTEAGLKQQLRLKGAIEKLLMTKVVGNVSVSDQAAKDFYDKNQDKMQKPERVHLRHILVRADAGAPPADKEKARAKTEALLKRIQNGEDFGKLASESSEDPSTKGRGGDLSWIVRGQAPPSFEKAAFALAKPNDLSPVVQTDSGYHIIQLVAHENASVAPFEEVRPKIAEFLKQRLSQQKLQVHVQELRAKGKVETFI